MNFTLNLVSDNAKNKNVTNPADKKIAQMKAEQNEKRASLFFFFLEYRLAYKAQQKVEAHAKSVFLMHKEELSKHKESDKDYAKYQDSFKSAKKEFYSERSKTDLRLDLLQYHTWDFCKANTTNLLDLA